MQFALKVVVLQCPFVKLNQGIFFRACILKACILSFSKSFILWMRLIKVKVKKKL
jgi:hypothetical protein